MKISDLVKKSGVPRETIHYYTREGLLPRPKKSSHNQADYTEEHVERLGMIKELQDRFFLPLSTIKKIIKEQKKSGADASIFQIKTEYFGPLDRFFPEEIHGEEAFLEATGMSAERLADFEGWRIINPKVRDGVKVYSNDDIKIGKGIGDLRRIGVSHEKGFSREGLKLIRDEFQKIVDMSASLYWDRAVQVMTPEEAYEGAGPAIEITAILLYHLYQRLSREEMARRYQEYLDSPNATTKA